MRLLAETMRQLPFGELGIFQNQEHLLTADFLLPIATTSSSKC
jgi:hypothetical protein